jgi:type VI secretion system secreted protein Hcp
MRHNFRITLHTMSFALVSTRTRVLLAVVAALAVGLFTMTPSFREVPVASSASTDFFIKIDGIDGESKDTAHKNEIEVLSWSWGMSNSGSAHTGGGAGAGKVSYSDLSIMKRIDKSSPLLMKACATGEHIPSVVLTAKRVGPKGADYIRYTLEDVLCTSLQDSGSGDTLPSESLSLNYTKIKFEYRAEGEARWSEFSWDLATNKGN